MHSTDRNWAAIIALILAVFIIGGGGYLYIKASDKLVSPIPPEPSFQMIFYTPTPGEATPTSTPSATPRAKKIKKEPTSTPKSKKISPTIAKEKEKTEEPTVTPTTTVEPT